MKLDCLDIGTIQSFLDGELANDEKTRVSTHVAVCDTCAAMLAQADDESAIVFPALAREFDTLVPTQRLWNRINESITAEKQQASVWEKVYAFFVATFASPSITVAAGLLIVAGVFGILVINRAPAPTSDAVSETTTEQFGPPAFVTTAVPQNFDDLEETSPAPTSAVRAERASFRTESHRPNIQPAVNRAQPAAISTADYMPGEESYVKTIVNLSRTVDEQKADGVLRPSQRIAYERDMAVVDDAISKMRAALKRNPKNESARQVLYSSYQNKIDLLNAVAQKEELIASR
ncbi:MAG: hypothetical protein ACKVQW_09405 [Pyrinomonadaceae bacterium]